MTQPTNQFQTNQGRLRLRPMTVADGARVQGYRSHPDVALFQGWTPATIQQVEDYARKMAAMGDDIYGQVIQLVIETLETPNSMPDSMPDPMIIGDVAFTIEAETRAQAELGIALDPLYQKQGYGREAIRALVSYLFDQYDLHRIHVSIDPENGASLRLFDRVGFRKEGHLKKSVFFKGRWCDDIIMAVLKEDWPVMS